ncbi:MAG: zinc-ribbon domain-containing protein [Eubacteriales bacterium]|nr:zinc-ribbon domain-containing protein [Eubacteriales bacterium]
MFCKNCGKELAEGSKFCPFCGDPQSTESNVRTVHLRCKDCGGIMEANPDTQEMQCPFCGSRELILDSDEVAAQKIRSSTYKEIEMAKLQQEKENQVHARERSEQEEKKADRKAYQKSFLSKLTIVFLFLSALMAFASYNNHRTLGALIAGAQAILFACSWMMGMQILKEKRAFFHRLILILALLLCIPFVRYGAKEAPKRISWPQDGLASNLPKPSSRYGEIKSNSSEYFRADLDNTTENKYNSYLSSCKEAGYTVDAVDDSNSYSAYNEEGYYLNLDYYSFNESLSISLDAPLVLKELTWPESTTAAQLPAPSSSLGKILRDTEDFLSLYVGDTSEEAYLAYVDTCNNAGFNVNYQKGDTYYRADNPAGYHLSLKYQGFSTMKITLEAPSKMTATPEPENSSDTAVTDSSETSSAETTDTDPSTESEESKSESGNGDSAENSAQPTTVDPELKEFLDSYETVMNSYCDFMEKYDTASETEQLSMSIDYLRLTGEYADMLGKMDAYDTSTMSAADLAYYTEVTTRVNARLLQVAQ